MNRIVYVALVAALGLAGCTESMGKGAAVGAAGGAAVGLLRGDVLQSAATGAAAGAAGGFIYDKVIK